MAVLQSAEAASSSSGVPSVRFRPRHPGSLTALTAQAVWNAITGAPEPLATALAAVGGGASGSHSNSSSGFVVDVCFLIGKRNALPARRSLPLSPPPSSVVLLPSRKHAMRIAMG